jgi:uncharacterized protein YjbI with pentapeptide repeats
MREEIEALARLGRLPSDSDDSTQLELDAWKTALERLGQVRPTREEVAALLVMLPPDGSTSYGLSFPVVNAIERNPDWPIWDLLESAPGDWPNELTAGLAAAGITRPGGFRRVVGRLPLPRVGALLGRRGIAVIAVLAAMAFLLAAVVPSAAVPLVAFAIYAPAIVIGLLLYRALARGFLLLVSRVVSNAERPRSTAAIASVGTAHGVVEAQASPTVTMSRKDPRVIGDASRPGAVDDRSVRELIRAANDAGTLAGRRVSVSRRHSALPTTFQWGLHRVHHVRVLDSDLAGLSIGRWLSLRRTSLDSSTFRGDNLAFLNVSRADISRTWFQESSLLDSSFDRSSVRETTFVDCDLRGTSFNRTNLAGVRFERTRMDRPIFRSSRIENVSFAGTFPVLFFIDCEITGLDLSAAKPDDVRFVGGSVRDVRLPRPRDCFAVMPTTFRDHLEALAELSPSGHETVSLWREMVSILAKPVVIVGPEFLGALDPADRRLVVETLWPHAITTFSG